MARATVSVIGQAVRGQRDLRSDRRCQVCRYLQALPADEQRELLTLMNDPTVQHVGISRGLNAPEVVAAYPDLKPPTQEAIRKYRNGVCACPRTADAA